MVVSSILRNAFSFFIYFPLLNTFTYYCFVFTLTPCLDAPTVRMLGAPQIDLEEGKDSLILRCVADANPPASIVWRRAGRSEIASLQESLQLRPVGRRDAGLYTCQAQNSVGTSDTMSVQLDVKCE